MEVQTKLTAGQISIMINARIKDMAMWLMEDFKYSLEEALTHAERHAPYDKPSRY